MDKTANKNIKSNKKELKRMENIKIQHEVNLDRIDTIYKEEEEGMIYLDSLDKKLLSLFNKGQ